MSEDYYKILNIAPDASADQIKKAYREAALKWHPDRNAGNPEAEGNFKLAAEAYAVLGDPAKRTAYDHRGRQPPGGFGSPFGASPFSQNPFGFSVDAFFNDVFRQEDREAPAHVKMNLEIDFMEAIKGCCPSITIQSKKYCTPCKGTGAAETKPCPACAGKGFRAVRQDP